MPAETIAGRYRVEREVGRGGMGSVWLCHDEVLGRTVAVKQVGLLPGETVPDLQRALREARSSAPLSHRNVVSIYDAIEEDDHLWLVMEYVPGRTLSQILAADGPLSPERTAWLGAQVADGLAAAHERGTVHRDVKPGNILVTDDDHAKIADFGISRTPGDPALTHTGLVSGTPGYFSPQLARGEDPSPPDDVWALGATLYTAVEGHPPYPEQRNAIATLSSIASGEPTPPERADFLAGPLERMLDGDPETRWSMVEVARALHRLHQTHDSVGTRASTAPAATAVLETVDTPAEEPLAAVPPLDPTPTPESTPESTSESTPESTPGPVPEPTQTPGARRGLFAVLGVLLVAVIVGGIFLLLDGNGADKQAAEGSPESGQSPSASASGSDPDPGTTTEPGDSPTPADETTEATPAADGQEQFVADYYASLPSDPETAWSKLSAGYQDEVGSYDDYAGFWSTIDAVSVDDTSAAADDAVDVTLTYTTDGASQSEVRRIELTPEGQGYLISGDQVVG